jgi:hypothetical protein
MKKGLVYVVGFLCAVIASVILHRLAQDQFGLSQESIVVGSLGSAGILSMACVVGTLMNTKK